MRFFITLYFFLNKHYVEKILYISFVIIFSLQIHFDLRWLLSVLFPSNRDILRRVRQQRQEVGERDQERQI